MVKSDELMNDKRYRTNPNASRELASRAVRAIKHWNYSQPEHKWCITNKLISELTGVTPKAIAKVVEGMGIDDYNTMQGLTPVANRMTKAAVGSISEVVSIAEVLGID
ncbi:MAG: phage tail assembly protein [Symploca sp. SIO1B1]|nr:phage tail assembly protein [Symploca sp. SIO1B1]